MQIHLSPRHLRLTAAIHRHTADKVLQLEELTDQIVAAHVVLMREAGRNRGKLFRVKVHLALSGQDIHADDSDADLHAALDKVTAKLARQLRKRHTAMIDKRRQTKQRAREKARRGL